MVKEKAKIEFVNVHKSFGTDHILQGIDLRIMPGESLAIVGGSGSGKSVLLKCFMDLLTPDSGDIYIDGKSILGLSLRERSYVNADIGMLFQYSALFDSLSVWHNVCFFELQRGIITRQQARNNAITLLEKVGLSAKVVDLLPTELSGGMRKRVGLARAIAVQPKILCFDEPTSGLDPVMGHLIDDLIIRYLKENNTTSITITHDMVSAGRIADRIAMLHHGKIIWTGPPSEAQQAPIEEVRQFVTGSLQGPITAELGI
ncbi:MAG: ATP-binding cassette domain-containing protein [Pseudomonadota bacterium]